MDQWETHNIDCIPRLFIFVCCFVEHCGLPRSILACVKYFTNVLLEQLIN